MLPALAITPVPRYSGQARVRSSSTAANPGGPARNEASHSPSASEVAMNIISMRPMNSRIWSLMRSFICWL